MQLRWSALIVLWTMLSGPVFSGHAPLIPSSRVPAAPATSASSRKSDPPASQAPRQSPAPNQLPGRYLGR